MTAGAKEERGRGEVEDGEGGGLGPEARKATRGAAAAGRRRAALSRPEAWPRPHLGEGSAAAQLGSPRGFGYGAGGRGAANSELARPVAGNFVSPLDRPQARGEKVLAIPRGG
ncbi:hypothetical protein P7K49_011501 [Saguinus oedipus]|uniref:Uncharacterized protein n=1 Tax=Saguinus oedipus TaxID=9490 RepID=A0ABQ9VQU6_SAGOE|nr:hypothetical protein P7K49_011501 [Saguinus oedipus]